MTEISRLSRLTSILIMLQSKRLITATQLSEKFEISVRTVYRDIQALAQAGVPIITIEGKGYRLQPSYILPPIMFTEQEAYALMTVEKLVSANKDKSLVSNYGDAINKIRAVLKAEEKIKGELLSTRIAVATHQGQPTSDQLSRVQVALTNRKRIIIDYHAFYKNEKSTRKIEPLAIYSTQDNWILIAWCTVRNALREFRLDRILSMQELSEDFMDRRFDLSSYFKTQWEKAQDP